MLNEGLILNDSSALLKSEIIIQIRRLGPTSPHELEAAVFKALVGQDKCEVDWDNTLAWGSGGYYARLFLNVKGREPDGVIDPAKVTRGALENAASIAAMILTTEALITDVPEEDKAPMPPMPEY